MKRKINASLIPAVVQRFEPKDGQRTWALELYGTQDLPDDAIKALAHQKIWIQIITRDGGAIIEVTPRLRLPPRGQRK